MQSLPGERHVQCNARTTQNHSQDVYLQALGRASETTLVRSLFVITAIANMLPDKRMH
jgi:hypothetical protein